MTTIMVPEKRSQFLESTTKHIGWTLLLISILYLIQAVDKMFFLVGHYGTDEGVLKVLHMIMLLSFPVILHGATQVVLLVGVYKKYTQFLKYWMASQLVFTIVHYFIFINYIRKNDIIYTTPGWMVYVMFLLAHPLAILVVYKYHEQLERESKEAPMWYQTPYFTL